MQAIQDVVLSANTLDRQMPEGPDLRHLLLGLPGCCVVVTQLLLSFLKKLGEAIHLGLVSLLVV